MAAIFNQKLLKNAMEKFSFPTNDKRKKIDGIIQAWQTSFRDHDLSKAKETSLQGKFFSKFFCEILGYTMQDDGFFEWTVQEATKKKKQDFSKVEFFPYDEGLCVQCMHVGSYDDEPATVDLMHDYMKANGYELDITDTRYHHEIYLSDPRKCNVSRLKTVVRHPIRKAE